MKSLTTKPRLQCRFDVPSTNIWAKQCPHPAKGERVANDLTGEKLPACGRHLTQRYVFAYDPGNSQRALPVREYVR